MTMTRKDYILVADAMHDEMPDVTSDSHPEEYDTWARIVSSLADVYAVDNNRFDRHRFAMWCVNGGDKT